VNLAGVVGREERGFLRVFWRRVGDEGRVRESKERTRPDSRDTCNTEGGKGQRKLGEIERRKQRAEGQTHVETVRVKRIPTDTFNIRPNIRSDPSRRTPTVPSPDRPIITPRQQHAPLPARLAPLDSLNLILMQPKAPHCLRTFLPTSRQIPQLDRLVRRRRRQQRSMLRIPGEPEDSVDVMVRVNLSRLDELRFLLSRSHGDRDVSRRLVGSAEESVRVEAVNGVERPDLDLRVKGTNGDVVSMGLCWVGRGRGGVLVGWRGGAGWGEIEPFEAEGKGGEHEVVVDVEGFVGLVVDVDFELGELVFGLGSDEHVVGGKNLELLSIKVVVVLRVQRMELA
jgi:hypothetical protein